MGADRTTVRQPCRRGRDGADELRDRCAPHIPTIRLPTLVLHRTGDPVVSVAAGRYLAEHIPGAKFVELPGIDHTPFVGDSDRIVDEVEEFLTGSLSLGFDPDSQSTKAVSASNSRDFSMM